MKVDTSQASTTRRTLTYSAQLLGRLHLDGPLLVGLGLLAMVGLLVLYSASGQSFAFTRGQGMRLILGVTAMIALAQVAPKYLRIVAPWLYGLGLVLLIIVELVGDHSKGAQRWLDLGVVRFQPSEIMKLALPMLSVRTLWLQGAEPGETELWLQQRMEQLLRAG